MTFDDIWQKLQQYGQDNEYLRRDLENAAVQPSLSNEETIHLLQRYRTAINANRQLQSAPPDDPSEKADLEAIAKDGDEARRQLNDSYQWLIMQSAATHLAAKLRFHDLCIYGTIGLYRAQQTFHHMRHCRFQDYATIWIERLIFVHAAQGDNGFELLPWTNLAYLQAQRHLVLQIRLGRRPTYEELGVVMGYLTPSDTTEIVATRRAKQPIESTLENRLRVAAAKAECLHKLELITKEFPFRLRVTINGTVQEVENVVEVEIPLVQEIEDLYHCGHSVVKRRDEIWLCNKCIQARNANGCGRYDIDQFFRVGRNDHITRIELYDGQHFDVEDDPSNLLRQFLI